MPSYTDSYSGTYLDTYGVPASGAPAFPAIPLDVRGDLSLNNAWTQIGPPYVYVDQEGNTPVVSITRGRPDESTQPVPCTAAFQVANGANEGYRFSPHNPTGAYYPYLGRNTPVRFHIPGQSARLRMEDDRVSYASMPSVNVAGDLELRIDAKLTDWTASVLASKWNASASWAWLLNANGTLSLWLSGNGSGYSTATSTQPLPWPGGRISLRATYANSTGVVTFYYSKSISGPWTQLGAPVTQATTGALFAGTQPVQVGANSIFAGQVGFLGTLEAGAGIAWAPTAFAGLAGSVYEFQMYSGIAGSLVADPVFSSQADGTTSFSDGQSNTWTLNGTAVISSRSYRFHGEVSEWPPVWDPTGTTVYTAVQASGPLRRASQGQAPVPSTLTRKWKYLTGSFAPLAYWPCEDGNQGQVVTLGLVSPSNAPQSIASGLPGGTPMILSSGRATQFASSSPEDFPGSNPLPVPGTDSWTGTVPKYTNPVGAAAIVCRLLLAVPSGGDVANAMLAEVLCTGSIATMQLQYISGGNLQILGLNAAGTIVFTSGLVGFATNGAPGVVEFKITYDGVSTYQWFIAMMKTGAATQLFLNGTYTATSLGIATKVIVNPGNAALASAIGQITIQNQSARMDTATSADSIIGPLNGWAGETAALRFARLCREQGYNYRITGPASQSVAMGPQTPQTFLACLQECETADHGLIYEPRDSLSLAYRTSGSMCAQGGAVSGAMPLALNYPSGHLGGGQVTAVDDDQLTINDETVTRGSGSVTGSSLQLQLTAAQYAATAAMSINPPPGGVGDYQDAQTVSVFTDSMIGDQSAWIIHQGTVNEPRYSSIPVDLADTALAGIFYPVLEQDCGDYLTISAIPVWLSPDNARLLAWGLNEQLGIKILMVQWACRPASVFDVLIAGTGALTDCRADTDGSTLVSGVSSGATSLSVATAAGFPIWTTAAGDLPFDIAMAGERMTVTNITGSSSPQTFTVTRSVNGVVKAQLANAAVNVFQPCYFALA